MMKKFNVILFLLFPVSFSLFSLSVGSTISPVLDINQTDNTSVIDKINSYNSAQTLTSEYYKVLQMMDEKIYLELHLGFGCNYFLDSNQDNHSYNSAYSYENANTKLSYNGSFIFKFNLFNPKLPYADNILTKIQYLKEFSDKNGVELSEAAKNQLAQIQKEIELYQKEIWYKRLSLGFGIPFDAGSLPFSNRPSRVSQYFLHYEDVFLLVGYDIGDIVTVELGSNIYLNRLFCGVSFDISTPSYKLGAGFIDVLKNLFYFGSSPVPPRVLY